MIATAFATYLRKSHTWCACWCSPSFPYKYMVHSFIYCWWKVLISRTALKLISLEMLIRWEWNVVNQKKKTHSFFFFHVITVIIIIIISFGWSSSSSIDPTHPSVNSSLVCKLHITYSWSHINFTSTKWNWNLNESEKNSTLVEETSCQIQARIPVSKSNTIISLKLVPFTLFNMWRISYRP